MVRIGVDMTEKQDSDDEIAIAAAEAAGATLVGGGSLFEEGDGDDETELGRDLEFEAPADRIHIVLAALEEAGFRAETLPEPEPEAAPMPGM